MTSISPSPLSESKPLLSPLLLQVQGFPEAFVYQPGFGTLWWEATVSSSHGVQVPGSPDSPHPDNVIFRSSHYKLSEDRCLSGVPLFYA